MKGTFDESLLFLLLMKKNRWLKIMIGSKNRQKWKNRLYGRFTLVFWHFSLFSMFSIHGQLFRMVHKILSMTNKTMVMKNFSMVIKNMSLIIFDQHGRPLG